MIDKKFLASVGVTEEDAVNKVLAQYETDIKAEKSQLEDIQKQLQDANTQIESFKGMNIEDIKKSADEWKEKFEKSELDRTSFEHKTKLQNYVKNLNLKDDIYENHLINTFIEKK